MFTTLYIIIIALCVAIFAIIYQNTLDVKAAYEEGFKKGLYMNVIQISNGNKMDVVDKYGNVYEKDNS